MKYSKSQIEDLNKSILNQQNRTEIGNDLKLIQ